MYKSEHYPNSLSVMLTACAGILPAFVFLIAPVFVGGLVEIGVEVEKAGFLLSAELGGFAVGGLLATLCLKHLRWQSIVYLSLSAIIVANLSSAYLSSNILASYDLLMWVRVICGLGSGSLAAIINVALSRAQNSERAFAYLLFAQLSFSALGIYLFPDIIAALGSVDVVFYVLSALCVLLFFSVPFCGERIEITRPGDGESSAPPKWGSTVIVLSALTMFFFYLAENAVWAFLEIIAEQGGISGSEIGELLGIIGLTGLAGAACAVIQADKLGRAIPILLTILVQIGVVVVLHGEIAPMTFLYLASIFNFLWNYCAPYLFAVAADVDPSGRAVALSIPALGMGLTVGPLIVGVLLPEFGLTVVNAIAIVALILAAFSVIPLFRRRSVTANALTQ